MEPKPAVIISELTLEWLRLHWPELRPEGHPQFW